MNRCAVIPATVFLMGCEAGRDDERPPHRVQLDAFDLGVFQVTNREYAEFVKAADHPAPPFWTDAAFTDPLQPVVGISWFDATACCAWLSATSGHAFRLPTEAEWECAARGGASDGLYPWADDAPQARPEYARRTLNAPTVVGTQPANAYGLHDLGENVHEWCSDWYDAQYYAASPEENPRGPTHGTRRASRGGSWRHQIKITRSAARSSLPPELRYADYGFRVARTR